MPRPIIAVPIACAIVGSFAAAPAAAQSDAHGATANPVLWPQVSYSVAPVGRSDDRQFAHMWAGAGLHHESGAYLLGGVDLDFRHDGIEVWMVGRLGLGWFAPKALAPHVALYFLAGHRLGKAGTLRASETNKQSVAASVERRPRYRLGVGLSIPALIEAACIGLPTMIELGADSDGYASGARYFTRLGWNF